MRFQTWQTRWNSLFLRLNQIEARAEDPERVAMARFLMARLEPEIPSHLVLRPRIKPEAGPACPGCPEFVSTVQLLVACTECLEVGHYECWRRHRECPACGALPRARQRVG